MECFTSNWPFFILSILLSCATLTTCCPRGCKCMQKNGEVLTVCHKSNLTEVPVGIPTNTEQLHLRDQRIKILRQGAFSQLTSLSSLALTQCGIEIIEPNAFTGLANLGYLDLQYNKIQELQPYAFSGLFALKRLLLGHNHLTDIQHFAFNGLNLTRLHLDNNPNLSDMSEKAFQRAKINEIFIANCSLNVRSLESLRLLYDTLRYLSWVNNSIPFDIPVDLFRGFNFQNLKLNNNGIRQTSFLEHVITDELSLEGNPTGPINFSRYPLLRQVRTLRLNRMGFQRVDGQYFENLPYLDELYLAQNGIMSLPGNLEPIFNRLMRLSIAKNNIYCNCELSWFKRWLAKSRTFVVGARCNHPYMEDILFIKDKEMRCKPPKITSIDQTMNVSSHADVTLTCIATGSPAPKITWHWPSGELKVIPQPLDRNQSVTVGKMVITSAQLKDQGAYRCDATNIEGNTSAVTEVLVHKGYDHQKGPINQATNIHMSFCVLMLVKFIDIAQMLF